MTAAQLDFDYTVRTTDTPLGSGGSVLQYGDALDVFGVHVQQCRELLFIVHGLEVHILCVIGKFEDVVVYYDQRLCVTVNGAGTAKTHGGT